MRVLFDTISDGSLYWDKLDADIYDTASIRDYLQREAVNGNTRKPSSVTHVQWHNDPADSKKELSKLFPTETEAIDAYFKKCQHAEAVGAIAFVLKLLPTSLAAAVRSALGKLLSEVYQPTADVLASLTNNPDIQGGFTVG